LQPATLRASVRAVAATKVRVVEPISGMFIGPNFSPLLQKHDCYCDHCNSINGG
jgi:hypothetical protein